MREGDDDMEVTEEDIIEAINTSDLPEELKADLLTALPKLMHNVGEIARAVFDPNAIWLESIQYADYVQQYLEHIEKCDDVDCTKSAIAMTKSFKQMAEHAMRVLDMLKIDSELVDWNTVKITYGKGKDAQQ